jgi:hypothetical protein
MATTREWLITRVCHIPSPSNPNFHPFLSSPWDEFPEDSLILQSLILLVYTSQMVGDQLSVVFSDDERLDARRAQHKVFVFVM